MFVNVRAINFNTFLYNFLGLVQTLMVGPLEVVFDRDDADLNDI